MKPIALFLLALALGGCANQFYGSAPAPSPGKVYVAGGNSGTHAIWLCPVDGRDIECVPVDVQDEE